MQKIAINGLGRIGRAALKMVLDAPDLELAAVNDLIPVQNLAYLINYDSVYGRFAQRAEAGKTFGATPLREFPVGE